MKAKRKKAPKRAAKKVSKKKATKARSRKKAAKKKAGSRKAAPKKEKRESWQLVDRTQLARLLGVHPDTVTDYAKNGMPVITRGGAGKSGVYDSVECVAWWRAQQGHNAKEAAQTRAYEAQADLNELKLERERGRLLPRDEVALAGQNYTKAWSAKVRAIPRRLVQAGLISRTREKDVEKVLHALLREISSWKSLADVEGAA